MGSRSTKASRSAIETIVGFALIAVPQTYSASSAARRSPQNGQ